MGVAENKSYKNEYHFTTLGRTKIEEVPSLNIQPKINSTIKDNPYKTNIEIEKDEIVLEPDMTALFKAVGKKHSGGGIDVLLKPNSFVFSDDKSLSISEKEHELMELKKGGKWNPNKNTPAEVLKRNIDLKHYNRLVTNITDVKQDDLAKKSSAMMLEKYIQSLGNIAFLQEKKKDFPDGLPSFSEGTAPVYDTDLKNEVMEQKQYAKYGGKINPYATGGYTESDLECPCGRDATGKCLPCPKGEEDKWNPYIKGAKTMGMAPNGYNEIFGNDQGRLLQSFTAGSNPYTVPGARSGKGTINNPQWMQAIQSMINKGATPEDLIKQRHITKEGVGMFTWPSKTGKDDFAWIPKVKLPAVTTADFNRNPNLPPVDNTIDNPNVPDITGDAQGVKRADWQFTPWQKLSQGYNLSQLVGTKRYMPFRSRFNASYVDPSLLNPEQAVGDARALSNQQLKSSNILNPLLRNAQASSIYGQSLDKIPAIRSQYDNQNAQILNQNRQYNNQVRNNETSINMGNDQQYYQQVINGLTNFDNMKAFQSDKYMNNVMRDVETNQALSYSLLTQDNPAYDFDWRTGNFTRNKKSILDAKSNPQSDILESLIGKIDFNRLDATQQLKYLDIMTKNKGIQYLKPQKKGGKINPYK